MTDNGTVRRALVGRVDALNVFRSPPTRDASWLDGAHRALSHYRNMLDHLPWALEYTASPGRLVEESHRYAEEALRDGVHIGLTDNEVAIGKNVQILHDWPHTGRTFYLERYGEMGGWACDTVDRLKVMVLAGDSNAASAESAWLDSLQVWNVVWEGYCELARRMGADAEHLRVTAWL